MDDNNQSKIVGRPSDYSSGIAEEICDSIASASKGLRKLCEENVHWPARSTIFKWLKRYSEFRDQYAQAKIMQVESLADDILDIADNSENDTYYDQNGNARCNVDWVNRCRLKIDTRKWLASKLAPRLYGNGEQKECTGCVARSEYENLSQEELLGRVDKILQTARERKNAESAP